MIALPAFAWLTSSVWNAERVKLVAPEFMAGWGKAGLSGGLGGPDAS